MDVVLREKVNRLLKAREASPDFLATGPGDRAEPAGELEQPGTIIARFKLLEKVGERGSDGLDASAHYVRMTTDPTAPFDIVVTIKQTPAP